MAKMTKAQAKKRLNECVLKLGKVYQCGTQYGVFTKNDLQKIAMIQMDLHALRKKFD